MLLQNIAPLLFRGKEVATIKGTVGAGKLWINLAGYGFIRVYRGNTNTEVGTYQFDTVISGPRLITIPAGTPSGSNFVLEFFPLEDSLNNIYGHALESITEFPVHPLVTNLRFSSYTNRTTLSTLNYDRNKSNEIFSTNLARVPISIPKYFTDLSFMFAHSPSITESKVSTWKLSQANSVYKFLYQEEALAADATAPSALKLAIARSINGVPFDGTTNITIYDNTKVSKTGNEEINGTKTFINNIIIRGQGPSNITIGAGSNDVFIWNSLSNKFLQLKDNGSLEYSNQKIYHEGHKPRYDEIQNKPTTIAASSLTDHVITNAAIIPRAADLNTYRTAGWYKSISIVDGNTVVNRPANINNCFSLLVEHIAGSGNATSAVNQRLSEYNTNIVWTRSCHTSGVWTSWKKVATVDLIPTQATQINALPITGGRIHGNLALENGAAWYTTFIKNTQNGGNSAISFAFNGIGDGNTISAALEFKPNPNTKETTFGVSVARPSSDSNVHRTLGLVVYHDRLETTAWGNLANYFVRQNQVRDNLTTDSGTDVLSARQGRLLEEKKLDRSNAFDDSYSNYNFTTRDLKAVAFVRNSSSPTHSAILIKMPRTTVTYSFSLKLSRYTFSNNVSSEISIKGEVFKSSTVLEWRHVSIDFSNTTIDFNMVQFYKSNEDVYIVLGVPAKTIATHSAYFLNVDSFTTMRAAWSNIKNLHLGSNWEVSWISAIPHGLSLQRRTYGFAKNVDIPNGTNLNDVVCPGFYRCASATQAQNISSTPVNAPFSLSVEDLQDNSEACIQSFKTGDGRIWIRNRNSSNVWSNWIEQARIVSNVASASKLHTPRAINGVNFDGTANITIHDNTKVSKTGDETIGGVKTFTSSHVIINNGTNNTILGIGNSDIYLKNHRSTKVLQLKNDGVLSYSNQKIYHEGHKPRYDEIQNKPTTIAASSLNDYVITNPRALSAVEDLNNIVHSGFYILRSNSDVATVRNTPPGLTTAFALQVEKIVGNTEDAYTIQRLHTYAGNISWTRSRDGFSKRWTEWKRTDTDTSKVSLSGNETITGVKTFASSPIVPTPSVSSSDGTVASVKFVKDNVPLKTTRIIAGNGLVGGGNFTTDVTVAIGTPGKITATSTNSVNADSHTHEIDKASTTTVGVVKLVDNVTTNSNTDALTAKQGKFLNDTKLDKSRLQHYKVHVRAKPAGTTINLTNRAELMALAGLDVSLATMAVLHIDFYNNANETFVGLPLPDKGPIHLDYVFTGSHSYVELFYRTQLRKFVSNINILDETIAYHWREVPLLQERLVTKSGNETISGIKTFTGNRINIGENKFTVAISGEDSFLRNEVSRKALQLKNDGVLSYSNQKIYHEGHKPRYDEIQNKPTTIAASSLNDYVITNPKSYNASHPNLDLNNFTAPGYYRFEVTATTRTFLNTPVPASQMHTFTLEVVNTSSNTYVIQTAKLVAPLGVWIRTKPGNVAWTPWQKLATTAADVNALPITGGRIHGNLALENGAAWYTTFIKNTQNGGNSAISFAFNGIGDGNTISAALEFKPNPNTKETTFGVSVARPSSDSNVHRTLGLVVYHDRLETTAWGNLANYFVRQNQVRDNLTTDSGTDVLSARQGRLLESKKLDKVHTIVNDNLSIVRDLWHYNFANSAATRGSLVIKLPKVSSIYYFSMVLDISSVERDRLNGNTIITLTGEYNVYDSTHHYRRILYPTVSFSNTTIRLNCVEWYYSADKQDIYLYIGDFTQQWYLANVVIKEFKLFRCNNANKNTLVNPSNWSASIRTDYNGLVFGTKVSNNAALGNLVPNGTNLNHITTPGLYTIPSTETLNSIANRPSLNEPCSLEVQVIAPNVSYDNVAQIITGYLTGKQYLRRVSSIKNDNTPPDWHGWVEVGASKLATPRAINGVNFDGTANITIHDNTKVGKTGDEVINGIKTFGVGHIFIGNNKMTVGTGSTDVYIKNHTSNKVLQLKNDGNLHYHNVKIAKWDDKSDSIDLDDTNKFATSRAVKHLHDKVNLKVESYNRRAIDLNTQYYSCFFSGILNNTTEIKLANTPINVNNDCHGFVIGNNLDCTQFIAEANKLYIRGQDPASGGTTATGWTNWHRILTTEIGVVKTDIVNNLTTNDSHKVLSAAQGKVLQDSKLGKSENARSASKLHSARRITLGGQLSGTTTFDGTGDVTIAASINHAQGAKRLTGPDYAITYYPSNGLAILDMYVLKNKSLDAIDNIVTHNITDKHNRRVRFITKPYPFTFKEVISVNFSIHAQTNKDDLRRPLIWTDAWRYSVLEGLEWYFFNHSHIRIPHIDNTLLFEGGYNWKTHHDIPGGHDYDMGEDYPAQTFGKADITFNKYFCLWGVRYYGDRSEPVVLKSRTVGYMGNAVFSGATDISG